MRRNISWWLSPRQGPVAAGFTAAAVAARGTAATEPLKLPPSLRSPMNWRIGKPFQLLNSPVVNDDIRKRTVPKSAPLPPPLHQLCRSDARYVAYAAASAAASAASSPRPFPAQYYCTTSVISYYFAVGRAILLSTVNCIFKFSFSMFDPLHIHELFLFSVLESNWAKPF